MYFGRYRILINLIRLLPGDNDFIVLSDGHAADIVFRLQIFGQRGAHDLPSDVRRRLKVATPGMIKHGS